jgi:predicted O-methyltransferase YrrM
MSEELEMFSNNRKEELFFLNELKNNHRVLEFGSGRSTLAISKRVKEVVSIEHNIKYYSELCEQINGKYITNTKLYYVPANKEPSAGYSDGTFKDFEDYVLFPLKLSGKEGRFDIVFVDGRSRVACALYAAQYYLKPNGLIFIHDMLHPQPEYRRTEYEDVLSFLELQGQEFAMCKFKVKENSVYNELK